MMIMTSTEEMIRNLVDIKAIKRNKTYDKIARMHKYWSRKPWYILEKYILEYSKAGDTILDPFCGSGAVGLEAFLNDRHFIGYDLNPSAIFITKNLLDFDFDIYKFNEEAEILENKIKSKIMQLYTLNHSDNLYIRYLIAGKNKKHYNCVATDYHFKRKYYVTVGDEILKQQFTIPRNHRFPDRPFPKKFYKDRFSYKGVTNVSDMFSSRNLLALTILFNFIKSTDFRYRSLFLLAFSNTILHVSKLKAENVRPLSVNNYWIPDDFIEENVIWRFLDRLRNIKVGKQLINERKKATKKTNFSEIELYNKSSLELNEIATKSVDYIITDPPYGDAIQYSELSFIWNCWLEKEFEIKNEVIINPVQEKGIVEFHNQIFEFLKNAKRVLKKNAYFTLCFQNRILRIWLGIIQMAKEQGFELHSIRIYDTFGNPYNKHWSKFSPKSDLYVTLKNSNKKYDVSETIVQPSQIIENIIRHLKNNNISDFDLNKGYDLFVATLIQQVFSNFDVPSEEDLDLKKIVSIFEEYKRNGAIPERRFRNIQMQLPF